MITALMLIVVPTLLFVLAFLYETYLSFRRLKQPKAGRESYVSATWEITHTLLIFAVVMLVMLFTKNLDGLASTIFMSTFLAAAALIIRSITYIYIFYSGRKNKINWIDWIFAASHVFAALFLVITVAKALWYLFQNNPPVNSQFFPYFLPGLVVILAVCLVPVLFLYRTK